MDFLQYVFLGDDSEHYRWQMISDIAGICKVFLQFALNIWRYYLQPVSFYSVGLSMVFLHNFDFLSDPFEERDTEMIYDLTGVYAYWCLLQHEFPCVTLKMTSCETSTCMFYPLYVWVFMCISTIELCVSELSNEIFSFCLCNPLLMPSRLP